MQKTPPAHEPLLTLDDVRAKHREIGVGERELARISAKLGMDRVEFQQMLVFVPETLRDRILSENLDPAPDLFAPPHQVQAPKPLTSVASKRKQTSTLNPARAEGHEFSNFVTELVNKSRDGISHSQLKSAVQNSAYAHRLEDQAKAYHRTIGKLIARNEIIRHGPKFYSPSVFEVLKKTGDLPEIESGPSMRENGAANIALEVLRKYPDGLSGPDLKRLVGADPAAPKSVTGHGQYIYNVLATLVGSGRVEKAGPLYRIVQKATPRSSGASGVNASGPAR